MFSTLYEPKLLPKHWNPNTLKITKDASQPPRPGAVRPGPVASRPRPHHQPTACPVFARRVHLREPPAQSASMRTPAKGSADDRAPASPGMVKRARHVPAAPWPRRQRADFTNVVRVTAFVALGCALLAWGARVGSAVFQDGEDAQILVHDRCPPPASRFVRARPLPGGKSTAELIAKAKASGEPCSKTSRTVVTMSSFYGRHQNLPLVVESILAQTCPPDRIYVFLSLAPLIDREFRHNKTRSIGYWRGVRRLHATSMACRGDGAVG